MLHLGFCTFLLELSHIDHHVLSFDCATHSLKAYSMTTQNMHTPSFLASLTIITCLAYLTWICSDQLFWLRCVWICVYDCDLVHICATVHVCGHPVRSFPRSHSHSLLFCRWSGSFCIHIFNFLCWMVLYKLDKHYCHPSGGNLNWKNSSIGRQ